MAQIIKFPQVTLINQNGVIAPAASPGGTGGITRGGGQTSPATWLVVLSGIAVADFTSVAGTEYTILIEPPALDVVNTAIKNYGLAQPVGYPTVFLNVQPGSTETGQLAPSAGIGSIFDQDRGTDGVFDIRAVVNNPYTTVSDATTNITMDQIFNGVLVGITARDSGPITYRLPYSFTMLAQIASVII
jgi:hypothetical protein